MNDSRERLLNRSPIGILRCTYIFFFERAESRGGFIKTPGFDALGNVALLIGINSLVVVEIAAYLISASTWFLTIPKLAILLFGFGIFGAASLYLGAKTRHDALVQAYRSATPQIRDRVRITAWSYVAGTAVSVVVMGFVVWPRH